MGGDASNFAARQLTAKIASGADLVVTMTKAHRDAVLELAPNKLHKTFTLIEAARLIAECEAKTIKDLSTLRPQLA
ncbi:MAG: low molecular weight phosphatase family protein, partial [Planctomycetaceae bacterium]